jgi:hypothetical protein
VETLTYGSARAWGCNAPGHSPNRLAVASGLGEGSIYSFELPGDRRYEVVTVALELDTAPVLDDFRS